MFHPFKGYEGP